MAEQSKDDDVPHRPFHEHDACTKRPLISNLIFEQKEPPQRPYRLAFFDLDNTLIPTSWIMQRWRAEENYASHGKIVQRINHALVEAKMFEALDALFEAVKKQVDRIIIITNAGSRTVENFYLTHCLPQLRILLLKHDIQLTSTEQWVITLGPPPSPDDEDAFREFYTVVKVRKANAPDKCSKQYREFQGCVSRFIDSVKAHSSEPLQLDIVSVGDQMCEISAACRLGECFGDQIRLLKLVLILDPTNSRFSYQQPPHFVKQLASLKVQTLRTADSEHESLMGVDSWAKLSDANLATFEVRPGVAYWVPQPESLTYAIGKPGRFPTEFPFYLPVEYMNLKAANSLMEAELVSSANPESLLLESCMIAALMDSGTSGMQAMPVDPNSILDHVGESDNESVDSLCDEDDRSSICMIEGAKFSEGRLMQLGKRLAGSSSSESFTSQSETTTSGSADITDDSAVQKYFEGFLAILMGLRTETDDDEDRPLVLGKRRVASSNDGSDEFQSDYVPSNDGNDDSDGSGYGSDHGKSRKRKAVSRGKGESNKKARRSKRDETDDGSWRRQTAPAEVRHHSTRDEQLFEDPRGGANVVDRRLERAIASITLEMLEGARIGQKNLLHMLEHPRLEEFIDGAYVRYPDLELIEAEGHDPARVTSFLPAQISRVNTSKTAEKVYVKNETSCSVNFELTILQYTQRRDGSLKIRKAKADLSYASNDPFTSRELEKWKSLLRLFSGREGADKLQTLPHILPVTAERLRGFIYTDEDVAMILKRKMELQDGRIGGGATAALNWRDLYLRKSEVEFQLEDIQRSMKDFQEASPNEMDESLADRLAETEAELAEIKKRLTVLRQAEQDGNSRAAPPQLPLSDAGVGSIQSSTAKDKGLPTAPLLTPRFLQSKAGGTPGSARNIDWKNMDCVKNMNRQAWNTGVSKLDSNYETDFLNSEEEWNKYLQKVKIRATEASSLAFLTKMVEQVESQRTKKSSSDRTPNSIRFPAIAMLAQPAKLNLRLNDFVLTKGEE